jgi:CheY-like chemotaxis protein
MDASVLIIDDDARFRRLAARLIDTLGLTVAGEAGSAADARAEVGRLRPDAAIVDVHLPDADGIELANEIAAMPWRPRVVLISSDPDASIRLRSGQADHMAFVAKPDLVTVQLRQLLTGGGAA